MKKIILLFVILCAASLFALADNPHITALAELVDVISFFNVFVEIEKLD